MEQLRDAAAEERIDLDELDQRLEQALKSKTHAELAVLTADLSKLSTSASLSPLALKDACMARPRPRAAGGSRTVVARGGMGGVKIDFTRVECLHTEIAVEAYGEMAGVTIVIPDAWAADSTGMDPGVDGLTDKTAPDRLPGTPLIRLTGAGGMAGVIIRHPNRWERRKLRTNPMHY
ncbi:DUF1707 domain-containing protein [Streptomyces sp. LHD-70]|uniref:DUF1707 SHOCT-like domain-containing protein n=1 Tax=Streptomyces sp. LHD-70 TaxID=3072140 RepID=UPI0035BE1924